MTADPKWSFEAHKLSEITQGRDNLAAAILFQVEAGLARVDPQNTLHLLGNLVIASCAAEPEKKPPADCAAEALQANGADYTWAHQFFSGLLEGEGRRWIFSLQHIPPQAPEIAETKRSRSLRVDEFIKQAILLDPNAEPYDDSGERGKHIYTGWYKRRIS